jgi:hypothetical protein
MYIDFSESGYEVEMLAKTKTKKHKKWVVVVSGKGIGSCGAPCRESTFRVFV